MEEINNKVYIIIYLYHFVNGGADFSLFTTFKFPHSLLTPQFFNSEGCKSHLNVLF